MDKIPAATFWFVVNGWGLTAQFVWCLLAVCERAKRQETGWACRFQQESENRMGVALCLIILPTPFQLFSVGQGSVDTVLKSWNCHGWLIYPGSKMKCKDRNMEICQREGDVFSWDQGVFIQAGTKRMATVRRQVSWGDFMMLGDMMYIKILNIKICRFKTGFRSKKGEKRCRVCYQRLHLLPLHPSRRLCCLQWIAGKSSPVLLVCFSG